MEVKHGQTWIEVDGLYMQGSPSVGAAETAIIVKRLADTLNAAPDMAARIAELERQVDWHKVALAERDAIQFARITELEAALRPFVVSANALWEIGVLAEDWQRAIDALAGAEEEA